MSVFLAVVIVTVLGLAGAIVLVVASHFMQVQTDERIELIQEVLPSVNCGACGFAGCADYAGAVVESGAAVNLCIPGGASTAEAVAEIMGVNAGEVGKQKAIVACQGTFAHRDRQYTYDGIETCAASATLHGGSSTCPYGCLGYGDCVVACKFDAIEVEDGVARVDMTKCTGCGACATACPKRVIWIREESEKPVVMCANHQRGAITRKACTAGCISCMKCEKVCPSGAIKVRDNVARIDLDKCTGCRACVNECPVRAITVPKAV
ncbi:RnfABCDGE type electron transport complex subunit B [Ruminococcaceae bacterium OttesenSCG-928-A16]|nr:RnfABCDGE type electron transport complex subunit B [Ruminococcaceae bacterium OttesenSCG-928-A16]